MIICTYVYDYAHIHMVILIYTYILACLQAVTGSFHYGKPVLFANRVPSWIFETRAPRYERVSATIEGGGREGKNCLLED